MAIVKEATEQSTNGKVEGETIEPLAVEPASLLIDRDPPPPRDWVCEGLGIPAARVTSLIGNGGFGKSTVAHQIALAVAMSRPLFGMPVKGGTVFGLFCEDEQAELDRKTRTICDADDTDLGLLESAYLLSRDGHDNVLCVFERDQIVLTDFYWQLDATVAGLKPRLTIIDTAADVFAGDFMSTPHVRQFIKVALGGLCVRHDTAVLLLAHPSASAMASGDGGGFSTAWNNSVRSRLYLRRPKSDDAEAVADRRVMEIRKANYGPTGATVPLLYERGRFVLDPEPIEERTSAAPSTAKADTRQAIAVMTHLRKAASDGAIVGFGTLYKALHGAADKSSGEYEKQRKALSRTLKSLCTEKLLRATQVPKGLSARAGGSIMMRGQLGTFLGTTGDKPCPRAGTGRDKPVRRVVPVPGRELSPGQFRISSHKASSSMTPVPRRSRAKYAPLGRAALTSPRGERAEATNEFVIRDSARLWSSDGHLAEPSNAFLTPRLYPSRIRNALGPSRTITEQVPLTVQVMAACVGKRTAIRGRVTSVERNRRC